MRKFFFHAAFFSVTSLLQAQTPSLLNGIWQGTDRIVLFSNQTEDDGKIALVLRVFYGWYSNRAAEPERFLEIAERPKNDAEAQKAEDISFSIKTIFENSSKTAGIYEISCFYNVASASGKIKSEKSVVPVAVLDGKIYLDFLVKTSVSDFVSADANAENHDGFWRAASNADGLTISPPRIKDEVRSYFVAGNEVYRLRYWKSDIEYSDAIATFSVDSRVFEVAKFLKIGDEVYQCTTGRSSKIRNIEKSSALPSSIFDSEGTICVLGEPYLALVPDQTDEKAFLENVAQNNKRKHEVPKPVFAPFPLDFDWKSIDELEKNNPATWSRRNVDLGK